MTVTFSNDKAIYLQMADRLCDEILAGTYGADGRIPSVREYAVMLEVNTNTAVKAYDALAVTASSTTGVASAISSVPGRATPSCSPAAANSSTARYPRCSATCACSA